MFTILIFVVIGLIFNFILFRNKDVDYKISTIATCIILSCFIGLLVSFYIPSKTKTVTKTYYLESLQDNNNINGRFFLGSGYINNKMEYTYYYKTDDGYKLNHISADSVLIRYDDKSPRIEFYYEIKTDDLINKFSILLDCSCNNNNCVIFLPKGSIKQNFELDLQ